MDASIPLSCFKLKKRKMPIKTSPPTARAMTLNERPTKSAFLLLKNRIPSGQDIHIKNDTFNTLNESFDEHKLIAYLFMEIRNDLRRTYA